MFRFIAAEKAHHRIATICRVLGVSRSGYHAWAGRPASARNRADETLLERITAIHEQSRGTYGAPRVHAELRLAHGIRVGRKRVARLMRREGLHGVHRRRRPLTTVRAEQSRPAPDLVDRDFAVQRPNQLWIADITYLPTRAGFLYLAVVLDACSRRVIGWSMQPHLRAELVLAALEMAIARRQPPSGVIHHSDQGCQYTSIAFGLRLRDAGLHASMGSVGDCFDNAMCESFFATLETELIDRTHWASHTQARSAVFDYIERFYNPKRRHSALGYHSPVDYERRYHPLSDVA